MAIVIGRRRFSTLIFAAFSVGLLVVPPGCSEFGPESDYWTHLGLDGHRVMSVIDTEWGLFAGTRTGGIFRLDTVSEQWVSLGLSSSVVASLLYLQNNEPKLLAGMSWRATEQTDAAVFATMDGGENWVAWDGGLASQYENRFWAYSLTVDPRESDRLYMGASYSILRSDDEGRTWNFLYGGFDWNGLGIKSIAVSPTGTGAVWASGLSSLGVGPVFRSLDFGNTWDVLFPAGHSEIPINAVLIDPDKAERIWIGAGGRIDGGAVLWSDDQGDTWTPSLREPVQVWALLATSDAMYAIAREFGEPPAEEWLRVYRRKNNGTTWDPIPTPAVHGGISATVDLGGNLVVGTAGSGVWRFTIP